MKDMPSTQLAQTLCVGTTRRSALRALAGGTIVGILAGENLVAADKRHRRARNPRRENRQATVESASKHGSGALKVMTRNLYLGADLGPVLRAQNNQQLVAATTQVFAMVQATNFPERAIALAEEIARDDFHLVGLQEVTRWRSQTPADSSPRPNAEDVEYDFLHILLHELKKRGKRYKAVATVRNTDAEAPRAIPGGLQDIRYTDHEVLLARTDLPKRVFSITNPQSANFAAAFSFPSPVLGDFTIPRGWVAVDATLHGRTARVVSTHLEPFHPVVQVAQARELLAGPADTPLPVVLLGDLNSAADGGGAGGPSDTPTYDNLIAAGFVDAWTATRGDQKGETWGHDEDLRNPEPNLTVRIDFVLTRGAIAASSANRVGEELGDRTASGLWPSDHAGVWAVLHHRDR